MSFVERLDPVIHKMHGCTVHVDPALLEGQHSAVGKRALSMPGNLYRNDFSPFVRAELAEFGPRGCEVLAEVWDPQD